MSEAVGTAVTVETLAIADVNSRYSRTTAIAGPTATQERAGTSMDANNSRAAKIGGNRVSTTAGTLATSGRQ